MSVVETSFSARIKISNPLSSPGGFETKSPTEEERRKKKKKEEDFGRRTHRNRNLRNTDEDLLARTRKQRQKTSANSAILVPTFSRFPKSDRTNISPCGSAPVFSYALRRLA
jgi:hypothetical protein